jgi:hypothetical protein
LELAAIAVALRGRRHCELQIPPLRYGMKTKKSYGMKTKKGNETKGGKSVSRRGRFRRGREGGFADFFASVSSLAGWAQ